MVTVRYYVGESYMGWERLNTASKLDYQNWLRSGNTLRIGDTTVTTLEQLNTQLEKLT